MNYDKGFWDKYSDENESRYNEEFAKFTRDLATSLRCTSILSVRHQRVNIARHIVEHKHDARAVGERVSKGYYCSFMQISFVSARSNNDS